MNKYWIIKNKIKVVEFLKIEVEKTNGSINLKKILLELEKENQELRTFKNLLMNYFDDEKTYNKLQELNKSQKILIMDIELKISELERESK